ncbi:MAG: hypothetical protein NBV65_09615 [Burkholderiaceae bacterium]|nr:hypothetical protein [Burkholderiaceae bacterium]
MHTMLFRPLPVAAAIAVALSAGTTFAQVIPDAGEALRQAQPPAVPSRPKVELPAIGGANIEPPMTVLPSGPVVDVKKIELVGNRELPLASLEPLVADAAGKSLTLPELEAVAQRVTRFYRSQGYFVARAYIPAQEVTDGAIKIRVVEGNYGQFILKNDSLVRDDVVQAMLDDVKKYDIVSLDTLERAMLIINDTPGVRVTRADVMPGQKVGTSDFAVDTAATQRRNGFVMLDNFGSSYTGVNRLSFNADINSPTGRGDKLSFSGLVSETADLVNGRVAYGTLLKPNGLRGELAVSQTQYALGGTYASLDARGTARSIDGLLTYPLKRTRATTVEASWGLSLKELEDEIRSTSTVTPKSLVSTTAGLVLRDERAVLGFDGLTVANAGITVGSLDIKDATALANDVAGAQTQGSYSKLVAGLSRVSLLPKSFTLTTSLRAQQSLSGKNLDGSERMSVSGSGGVMAYPPGELIGTNAMFARAELSRPLPVIQAVPQLSHNWLAFTSWGQASAAKAVSASDSRRAVSDVGLGWTGNWKGAVVKAYAAYRLQDTVPVSEPTDRLRLLLQAGWVF